MREYLYDPLGNITADGVHEYIYDLRNRLVSIDNGDVGQYLIGPLGERLWKKGIIPGQAVFDPNGDGVIDKEDLIAVRAARKAFRKYGTFTPEADCTGDGTVIDKADSVCMRQRLRYQRKMTRWSEKTAILSAMLVGKSPDCTGDGVVDEADKLCVKEKVRNARPRRNHVPVIDLAGDCTGDGLLNRDDRICVRRYINISARLVKIAAKVTELESWAASLPYPVTGGGGASQDEEEVLFFAYDADGSLIGEYDASGAPVRETIRLAGLPVGVISNGVTYRIHPDHLGSPRAITDDVDKVIWRWTGLNPFGLDAADEDPDGDGTKFTFNQRFPGQYFDGESGFHYNYYRDFSPSTGRYVQSDPIGLEGGLNTYGYVSSDPLGWIDPTGLFPIALPVPPPPVAGNASPGQINWNAPFWPEWIRDLVGTPFHNEKSKKDEKCDPHEDFPSNPDDWTVPDGWVETPTGEKTDGRHRQWKGPKGEWRRWDKEGRKRGKDRGPHWHDWRHPGTHIKPK